MMSDLPDALPIFQLSGVLLLRRGEMTLHIFEPRYKAKIDDALGGNRMLGIVQPKECGALFEMGCAGKITTFEETQDGRYYISLSGICRYRIEDELEDFHGYRRVKPD